MKCCDAFSYYNDGVTKLTLDYGHGQIITSQMFYLDVIITYLCHKLTTGLVDIYYLKRPLENKEQETEVGLAIGEEVIHIILNM